MVDHRKVLGANTGNISEDHIGTQWLMEPWHLYEPGINYTTL